MAKINASPITRRALPIRSRFNSVIRSHPSFSQARHLIGSLNVSSTRSLIESCQKVEETLVAPFRVFLHGDFNANNIMFNPETAEIHYIDLYRSKEGDYVQDSSVFLISCFRMPNFQKQHRSRLNSIIEHFYRFFSAFARQNHDTTFELRMALALARSFFTSTRFEMKPAFAKEMWLRANYLMTKVASLKAVEYDQFRLPEQILYY